MLFFLEIKRKSEEGEDESSKKPKQEAGGGDAKVNGSSEKVCTSN